MKKYLKAIQQNEKTMSVFGVSGPFNDGWQPQWSTAVMTVTSVDEPVPKAKAKMKATNKHLCIDDSSDDGTVPIAHATVNASPKASDIVDSSEDNQAPNVKPIVKEPSAEHSP